MSSLASCQHRILTVSRVSESSSDCPHFKTRLLDLKGRDKIKTTQQACNDEKLCFMMLKSAQAGAKPEHLLRTGTKEMRGDKYGQVPPQTLPAVRLPHVHCREKTGT